MKTALGIFFQGIFPGKLKREPVFNAFPPASRLVKTLAAF